MPRFLYVFEFQTPAQFASKTADGEVERSCEALFIDADTEDLALQWGRKISESFVNRLFPDSSVSWSAQDYSHGIESDPAEDYPEPILQRLQTVAFGVEPDFEAFKHRGHN